jgi:hypothetical protein
MSHAKTSFSTELFTGAKIGVVQYLAPLRYAISDWEEGSNTTKTSGQSWYQTNAQTYLAKPPWHEYVNCHGICVDVEMLLHKKESQEEPCRTLTKQCKRAQQQLTDNLSPHKTCKHKQITHSSKPKRTDNKQSPFHQRQAPFLAWFSGAMSPGALNLWGPIIILTIP